jgi:hypothetical protein
LDAFSGLTFSVYTIDMQRKRVSGLFLALAVLVMLLVLLSIGVRASVASDTSQVATPTADRLAMPVLPESPTGEELGEYLYYHHCMPCHGDRGQGLTDEWREVWVDDHQNCWAGGCHAGRAGDEGFPLPRIVPAVCESTSGMAQTASFDNLVAFLRDNHPPQNPGVLDEQECWALTTYLFHENGRSLTQIGFGDGRRFQPGLMWIPLVAVTLGLLWGVFRGTKRGI